MAYVDENAHILVVCNNEDMKDRISHILGDGGYTILTSNNVDAGGEIAQKQTVHVIIVDETSSNISCMDMCKKCHQEKTTENIPVVAIIGADATASHLTQMGDTCPCDYVPDSFAHWQLLSCVERALALKKMEKELAEAKTDLQKMNTAMKRKNAKMKVYAVKYKKDTQMAKQLQQRLIPSEFPKNEKLVFTSSYIPSREPSGDFFDFVEMVDDSIGIIIGDVSGRGLGGIFVGTIAKISFENFAFGTSSPKFLLEKVNRKICDSVRLGQYVTLFYGIFNPNMNSFRYVQAGHPAPILIRKAAKTIEFLETNGGVLGLDPNMTYEENDTLLTLQDRVILYTNGILEIKDKQQKRYGKEKLAELIKTNIDLPTDQLIDVVLDDIREFTGRKKFDEDITILAFEVIK